MTEPLVIRPRQRRVPAARTAAQPAAVAVHPVPRDLQRRRRRRRDGSVRARVFERRLKELRYETGDQSDRLDMLHEIGARHGPHPRGACPGFTGALDDDPAPPATLVHLRLTLSAAELALLPFELAEVPVGSDGLGGVRSRRGRRSRSRGTSAPSRPKARLAGPAAHPVRGRRPRRRSVRRSTAAPCSTRSSRSSIRSRDDVGTLGRAGGASSSASC